MKHRRAKVPLAALVALLIAMGALLSGGPPDQSRAESIEQPTVSPTLLEALESPPGLKGQGAEAMGADEPFTPEETQEVEESRTHFRDLSEATAVQTAEEQFPGLINELAYRPLDLADGEKVTEYSAPNVAQLSLPEGEHGVAESALPFIVEGRSGKMAPVELSLREAGGTIEPINPLTPLQIPSDLSQGIHLPRSEVTLTPLDPSNAPLKSAASIEGATAFYANTEADTDTVVKPMPAGFETESLLRSPESPEQLRFRLEGPIGAQIAESGDGSFAVEVDDKSVVTISPAAAVDANGTPVPVSMAANGNQLFLTVDHSSGEYQYPIAVDPTVSEKNWGSSEQGPWYFTTNSPYNFVEPFPKGNPGFPEIYTPRSYPYGTYGAWNYTTQGSSRIYSFEPSVWSGYTQDQMTNLVGIVNKSGSWEPQQYLGTYVYPQKAFLQCPVAGCPSTGGTANNTAVYEKIAINSGPFADALFQNLGVKIAQDTGPSIAFDTSDKEIEGHPNPLYGSGVWLTSANEGRIKATGTDPGIGIYKRSLISTNYSGWSSKLTFGSATGCVGIQCLETYQMPANVANLPEGINTIEAKVENATGAIGTKTAQIKIDNTAPSADVDGLPANYTISRGSVHKLAFVLSDGEAPTASSGIAAAKSEVQIDGEVVLGKTGAPGCTPGPCQVTRTYELLSRNEGPGVHTIKVTAEDGTGNNVVTEVPFLIKAGPSEDMGPGALDLASGAYSLTSADVSPSSVGNGLSLTRSYNSQNLPVAGSPFGPSWQMSLGGWQGVERLTDGGSVFTDARGRSMLFKAKEGGGYVPPSGYQGWSLTYDPGASYTSSIGSEGVGNGQFMEPVDVARDLNGNLWVIDKWLYFTRVQEFSKEGAYIRQFGSPGAGNGQFSEPSGIAADVKGNIWVADTGNNRIQKFNEKGEFLAKYGIAGSGNGQFNKPLGIDADVKGNIWVADTGNNRVQKFNEAGEYKGQVGTFGSGSGQMSAPAAVAGDSKGNVWVADTNNNRIEEFNEKLEFLRKAGSLGSGSGQMNHPRGIASDPKGNVWVSDGGNGRVEQFSETGTYVGKFGSLGSGASEFNVASGLATDFNGNFWIADNGARKVKRWSVSGGSIAPASYKLSDLQGDVTTFKQPSAEGSLFLPSATTGPNGYQGASFKFEVVEGAPRPSQVLGPVPAGISCTTLVRGCRALTFAYDASTTATSDEPSGWGSYKGRLHSVDLHAWNPESGSMATISIVNYSYDVHGRLRAAWDPRVSPALKTIYGYDPAGHVTALTPPGQQTWVMNYGTIAGDSHTDWLLSVSRTKAATPLGGGEAPKNTVAPTFSNNYPVVGTTLSAWNGTWSNSPLGYNYQWSDCNSLGVECTAISGATSQTYKPISGDLGHRLVVSVTATNSGGAATAVSAATAEVTSIAAPIYSSQFGSAGTGDGQFSHPADTALDSKGNIWVVDKGNSRIEKFNEAGEFLVKYGSAGSGNGQLSSPGAIAIDSSDNVWIADTGNNRIEKFNSSGEYLLKTGTYGTGNGQFSGPEGIAVDSKGNVWVSDTYNGRVQKFNSSGEFLKVVGSYGSEAGQLGEPTGIDVSSSGNAYIADWQNQRIAEFNEAGTYVRQFGAAGTGNAQFAHPDGLDVDSSSNVWVADEGNGRIQEFSSTGGYLAQFGSKGTGAGQFTFGYPVGLERDGKANIWIADTNNNRVQKWRPETTQNNPPSPDPTTALWTAIYHLPISGTGAPANMSSTEVARWGQSDYPNEATAIFPPDQVPSRPPANFKRATVYYMDNSGNTVDTLNPGGRITTSEYDSNENLIRSLSAGNRAVAMEAGTESATKAKLLDTQFTYSTDGTELTSVLGPKHKVKLPSGKEVEARLHTQYSYDQGAPEGGPYHLVTTETEGAQITGEADADVRTKTFSYGGQSNLGWSLRQPTSTTVDPGGLNLVSRTIFDPVTGNVTETRKPGNPEGGDAHSTQTIYYSAKSAVPAECGEHAEWADLPCQTRPAAQPGSAGLPDLPTTTARYNLLQEPTTTTSTSGSASRTQVVSYDGAGRPTSVAVSGSSGAALPTVNIGFSPSQGMTTTASATGSKGFEASTSEYNSLGQLTSYTDGSGVVSAYGYDIDGRPTEVSDGKGTQTGTYDATTGDLTKLVDSDIGATTATYDAQGNIATERYPNGMTIAYTYDSTGTRTKQVDTKTTSCTEGCTWYSDEITPSIHGQWLKEVSTRVTRAFAYDSGGRLTQAQETPLAAGCTTTLFGYDADADRTSLTTRAPKEGGGCSESGGSTVLSSYDSGDRQTDPGVTYDSFGGITELPAAYAGGALLQSTYYVDGSLATQTQSGQTLSYRLDPLGRESEVTASGSSSSVTVSHFSSGSDSPSWTVDESGSWTRYVGGLDGGLTAIRQGPGEPVLQISNLHGDIVATAPLSEAAKSLTWTTETTAAGVPRGGKPAKYGWLGSAQRPTELESGVVNLGSRSYVPQQGRTLQPTEDRTDASAYVVGSGDPINESAVNGRYTPGVPVWLEQATAHPANLPPPPPPPTVEGAVETEESYALIATGGGGGGASASSGITGAPFHMGECGLTQPVAGGRLNGGVANLVGSLTFSCRHTATVHAFYYVPHEGAGPVGWAQKQKSGVVTIGIVFEYPAPLGYCVVVASGGIAEKHCQLVKIFVR